MTDEERTAAVLELQAIAREMRDITDELNVDLWELELMR